MGPDLATPVLSFLPRRTRRVSRVPAWSTYRLSPEHFRVESDWTYKFCLFTCPRDQTGQGFDRPLGEADTSLREQGRLPGTMVVDAVEWRVFGGTEADRLAVVEGGAWSWDFGATGRTEGSPLATFDAGDLGLLPEDERAAIVEALRARDGSVNGRLSYEGQPGGAVPVHLPDGCSFCLVLSLRGVVLSRETFVRFTLRGTCTETVHAP